MADTDSPTWYRDWIEYNIEVEALDFCSSLTTEHHFTGLGQVSASLKLMTYFAAKTTTLRPGTAAMPLPWHNPVLLAEQAATLDLVSDGRLYFGVFFQGGLLQLFDLEPLPPQPFHRLLYFLDLHFVFGASASFGTIPLRGIADITIAMVAAAPVGEFSIAYLDCSLKPWLLCRPRPTRRRP